MLFISDGTAKVHLGRGRFSLLKADSLSHMMPPLRKAVWCSESRAVKSHPSPTCSISSKPTSVLRGEGVPLASGWVCSSCSRGLSLQTLTIAAPSGRGRFRQQHWGGGAGRRFLSLEMCVSNEHAFGVCRKACGANCQLGEENWLAWNRVAF